MADSEVRVSVYCLAYNHVKYIKTALEGFVSQKTDFIYEVIIHDDASDDGTSDVIREYAEKYPAIIKPIFQTENQYSKRVNILKNYVLPYIKGDYIAICEGDDYWCDDNKLQLLYDFLENHKDYSACVHNTEKYNCRTGKRTLINSSLEEKDICFEDVVAGGNVAFQMSGLMYRREYLIRPDEFYAKGFGDYPLSMYLAIVGKIHYFPRVMSVYRLFADGSWTTRNKLEPGNEKRQIANNQESIALLERVDKYTDYRYHTIISDTIRSKEYIILLLQNKFRDIYKDYKDILRKKSFFDRFKLRIKSIINILKNNNFIKGR